MDIIAIMDTTPPPQLKKCTSCRRVLPSEFYGVSRGQKDGLGVWCKKCTSYSRHVRYARDHGIVDPNKMKHDYLVPMNVGFLNDELVSLGLIRQTFTIPALHVPSLTILTVAFSTHQITIANTTTQEVWWGSYMGVNNRTFKDQVLEYLRANDIRLEKDDISLQLALKLVYKV